MKRVLLILALTASSVPGADSDYNGRWDITVGGKLRGKALWQEFDKMGADQRGLVWWLEIEGAGSPHPKGRFVSAYQGRVNVIERIAVLDGELNFGFVRKNGRLLYKARIIQGKLEGTFQIEGQDRPPVQWTGVRAPVINEKDDGTWRQGERITLFNGKDFSGWRPTMSDKPAGWEIKDGTLVLTGRGGENSLVSDQKFWNFELHIEFKLGPKTNSGIGLRARYEVQILQDFGRPPGPHGNGAVYGFIAPAVNASKPAGEWQTYDIRLVGRQVTVVLNGKTIIDKQEIEGLTALAVDANEGQPGPILLQSASGPVAFRNIVLTTLVK
ncbi:MAG: DUF1080 domain-containing protein [Bryobacteraceae bacterium]